MSRTTNITLTDDDRAEIRAIISARISRYVKGVTVAYVLLLAGLGFALHENGATSTATHNLAVESAATRVHTVSQRCALTGLLAEEIPSARIKLLASEKKCNEQLVEVEAIAKQGGK
jgi:hypothetical protein